MFVLTIYPLTLIPRPAPQVLTYFYSQKLPPGSLVSIPLRKSKVRGIIVSCEAAQKIAIKKAGFEIKGIQKIISDKKIIEPWQIKLAEYLADYYWTSPGVFLKMMLLHKNKILNIKNTKYKLKTKKRQTLILVPEVLKIKSTIKELGLKKYVILHSGLKKKEYQDNWLKIKNGQTENIIGTRIAVFAPIVGLKKIIIIDESSPHHKSWDMHPQYRVHEVARKLSKLLGAQVIFEAPVPSVETNYLAGKYGCLKTSITAKKQYPAPRAQIIDMREELKQGNFSIFSQQLHKELKEIMKNKKQAIFFINHRGAGTFVLCRDCGYTANCPGCGTPLVLHLVEKNSDSRSAISNWRLSCHHCGHQEPPPGICPRCRSTKIKAFGAGTQKVELELKKIFPELPTLRLDSDITLTQKQQNETIENFKKGKAKILIATQMLFSNETMKSRLSVKDPRKIKKSKIFNFSGQSNNISLLAMVSADTILRLPDFRSGERTFQTIQKLKRIVSANLSWSANESLFPQERKQKSVSPGAQTKVCFIIQTYNPENYAIKCAASDDWKNFYQKELSSRRELDYPPFSQIIKLSFAHRDQTQARDHAKILFVKLSRQIKNMRLAIGDMQLLGPSPAFIPKQKGKFIWQILIKSKLPLSERNEFLRFVPSNWQVKVDPESTL